MNNISIFSLLLTTILTLIGIKITHAQPGWQDRTYRYFYTIVDKKGKEISFSKNKQYSIMVDNVLFKSPRIPQKTLKPALPYKEHFDYQIKINDFSLAVPQKNSFQRNKRLEIKIIHKRDTMFICQPSGQGSFAESDSKSGKKITQKNKSDFTLQFITGHYYFPDWAKYFLDNLAQIDGKLEIVNISQDNFLVTKGIYDSVHSLDIYRHEKLLEKADNYVLNNFLQGHISLNKWTELTQFKQSATPYKSPHWEGSIYASKDDKNRYYGMMSYSMNSSKCSSYKKVFSILNKRKNTIKQFYPKDNLRLFGSSRFYVDTFNKVIYLPLWTKKEFNFQLSDCQHNIPAQKQTYQSLDEGRSWQVDTATQILFDKFGFREFEFLDENYALGYNRRDLKQESKKVKIVQGTYYLLHNMRVIDSLKTPDDIYYNSNYNNYRFKIKNDTILLGPWSYDRYHSNGATYFQPFLIKNDTLWKFQLAEKIYARQKIKPSKSAKSIKEYQNFHLYNEQELVLKNGAGSLTLQGKLSDDVSAREYYLIEKDQHIYLLNNGRLGHIYMSFNGGTTWYFYPLPLEDGGLNLQFIDIDEKNVISHFRNKWENNEKVNRKVFHSFSLE